MIVLCFIYLFIWPNAIQAITYMNRIMPFFM